MVCRSQTSQLAWIQFLLLRCLIVEQIDGSTVYDPRRLGLLPRRTMVSFGTRLARGEEGTASLSLSSPRIYPSISRQHFEFLGVALPLRFIAFFAVINFGSIKDARKDSVESKPTTWKILFIFLPRKVVKKLWAVPYLKSVTHVNLRAS